MALTQRIAYPARVRERLFLSPPHMSGFELALVREAFESNYIAPLGPMVDAFEKEFAAKVGISHAVALASGTSAAHLALRILGVGPGDEVLASTFTFIGSVSPILYQGATPVFIDSDRTSWNMDPVLLEEELEACLRRGHLPKAVVPTDIYGQCADYDRIKAVCNRFGVPVLADSAEALGAVYKGRHAGAGLQAAVFSFNGNKIITTSGGGMLVSEDRAFIETARFLSQQARDPAPHYEHSQFGYNYRMSNILAAIGRGQLRSLDERIRRKREIFAYYRNALGDLPGIEFMPEASYGKGTRWLTVILIRPEAFGADREAVRQALDAENIESRPAWKPMHLQPIFDCGTQKGGPGEDRPSSKAGLQWAMPALSLAGNTGQRAILSRAVGGTVAEDLFLRGLCLPSGTGMTEEDLERVVSVIRRCRR
jgi:dTDP-4-amino-4,6-dideoxygalactose transaminase